MTELNKMKIVLVFIFLVSISGCVKKPEGKVLARINNYELTVSDFRDETSLTKGTKSLSSDPLEAKRQLLQEIINKKILILEAQKLNFDKDKAFMREIERYWEQALLKLLLKKKSEELLRTIEVGPEERDREEVVDRKRTEALDAWIEGLRDRAKVEINEDALREVDNGKL